MINYSLVSLVTFVERENCTLEICSDFRYLINNMTDNETATDCTRFEDLYPDRASATTSKIAFTFLYVIIFVLGCSGNVIMLYVTLTKRAMITVQNIFLMNLAVGDIVVCLLSVPVTPIVLVYKEWYFGAPLCHLIMWVQGSSVFISTLTLTAIALDRYLLIVYPHRNPTTIKTSLHITAVIWTFSGTVTLPYAYFMRIVRYEGVCGEFCDENWPSETARRAFTTVVFACQFVIPFAIMSYCYVTILNRLKRRIKTKISRTNFRRSDKMALNKRKRRSTVVLVCMVSVFGLTWLPHNVISMITNYTPQGFIHAEYLYFAYLVTHCFAMLSILANPVLYAWLNSAFRKIILKTCAAWRLNLPLARDDTARRREAERAAAAGVHPELCTDYLMRHGDSFRRSQSPVNGTTAPGNEFGKFLTPNLPLSNNNIYNSNYSFNNSSSGNNNNSSWARSTECRTPTPELPIIAISFEEDGRTCTLHQNS